MHNCNKFKYFMVFGKNHPVYFILLKRIKFTLKIYVLLSIADVITCMTSLKMPHDTKNRTVVEIISY